MKDLFQITYVPPFLHLLFYKYSNFYVIEELETDHKNTSQDWLLYKSLITILKCYGSIKHPAGYTAHAEAAWLAAVDEKQATDEAKL